MFHIVVVVFFLVAGEVKEFRSTEGFRFIEDCESVRAVAVPDLQAKIAEQLQSDDFIMKSACLKEDEPT